jgi:membrane-associated phospholipid phosphatase
MQALHRADARVGDAVRAVTGDRGPVVDAAVRITTDLGSMFMVVWAGATLERLGHRRAALEVLAAGNLGWVIAQEAKRSFDRPRPYQAEGTPRLIPEPSGSSLPSGHAAVAAAVATVLADRSAIGRRWPWVLMAVYVPLTRVHLGVHYPTDTLAGALLGHGLGRVVRAVSRRS